MTNVLLVDDDADIISFYERMLDGSGLQVVGKAGNGRQGIQMAKDVRPDIILLDLSMPEADGLEVITALRESHPAARIVVVSGFHARHLEPITKELGAHSYVMKGAGLSNIQAALQEAADAHAGTFARPSPERIATLVQRARELI